MNGAASSRAISTTVSAMAAIRTEKTFRGAAGEVRMRSRSDRA
jgi:hypothetical protein